MFTKSDHLNLNKRHMCILSYKVPYIILIYTVIEIINLSYPFDITYFLLFQ